MPSALQRVKDYHNRLYDFAMGKGIELRFFATKYLSPNSTPKSTTSSTSSIDSESKNDIELKTFKDKTQYVFISYPKK